MPKAASPADEPARLEALRDYDILDTPPEQAFDDLTRLAAQICGVPIALVSLVDAHRQWFKSTVGTDMSETPRDIAFCDHTIAENDLFVVEDAAADERFATNPLVTTDPHVRFYAGVPLITHDGHALGALCVQDTVPRHLSAEQTEALRILGRQVENQLELRRLLKRSFGEREQAEDSLRRSQERHRLLVQESTEAIYMFDLETKGVVETNKTFLDYLGYTADEALDLTIYDFVAHPRADIDAFVDRILAGDVVGAVRLWRRKDGSLMHVDVHAGKVLDGEEGVGFFIARDITERKRAQDALREREERLRVLVEHLPAVVYIAEAGADGRWLYVSPQIEELIGFTPEEWMADPHIWFEHIHPDDRDEVLKEEQAIEFGIDDSLLASVYRMITRDGRTIWVRDDGAMVRDENGVPLYFSGALYDITERKRLEDELKQQAFHDSLTGLANRALFIDRVEHALARAQRSDESVAVLFLDLDDFKTVNDGLGHEAGDRLLVAVANRLRGCLRPSDTIARLGGDEFAILLEGASARSASVVAKRAVQAVKEPFSLEGREVVINASVGIEVGGAGTLSASDFLRNADVAMYVAKGRGKARFEVFDAGMHGAALRRLEMRADLQRAINNAEFTLQYQPIVRLADDGIEGVEALIRWQHPGRGLVSPADFIPVAEDTGLIIPLGRWVIREACRQVKAWQQGDYGSAELGVSVNASGRQLLHSELVEEVAAALSDSGLAPEFLTVEITESVLMSDTATAIAKLQELRKLGVRVAVDDFGTGYSSLSYLSSLPIDILKLDKTFVDGVAGGPEDSAIAQAVVKLGNSLRLIVVAEGIESAEQVTSLRGLECARGQGYYFSKPQDADAIEAMLRLTPIAAGRT